MDETEEIINKTTGEITDGFLIRQFSKSGLPVFVSRIQGKIYWSKKVKEAIVFYDRKYAEERAAKLRYGHIKVVTLKEARTLEKEGAPSPVNFANIERFRMREY